MAKLKTIQTELAVAGFLDKLADDTVRTDCYTISKLMEKVSGEPAKMWGTAIVGFGEYHYKYATGHEGDMCLIGFSPRKANITLYVLCGFDGQDEMLARLGKHKASGGCLHVKKLSDINIAVLNEIVERAFANKVRHTS